MQTGSHTEASFNYAVPVTSDVLHEILLKSAHYILIACHAPESPAKEATCRLLEDFCLQIAFEVFAVMENLRGK